MTIAIVQRNLSQQFMFESCFFLSFNVFSCSLQISVAFFVHYFFIGSDRNRIWLMVSMMIWVFARAATINSVNWFSSSSSLFHFNVRIFCVLYISRHVLFALSPFRYGHNVAFHLLLLFKFERQNWNWQRIQNRRKIVANSKATKHATFACYFINSWWGNR